MVKARLLLVDPDPSFLDRAASELSALEGVEASAAADATAALDIVRDGKIDAVVSGHEGRLDALSLMAELRRIDPELSFMVVADEGSEDLAIEALEKGADHYCSKKKDPLPSLMNKAVQIAERCRRYRDNELDRYRLQTLVDLAEKRSAPFHEMAHFMLESMVEITGSKMGYIATVDTDEGTLNMFAWSQGGLTRCRMKDRPVFYRLEETGLWGEPVRQGRSVMINDYSNETELQKGSPKGHVSISRYMAIPVYNKGRIVATCGVANKAEPYDDDDLRQLTMMMHGMEHLYDINARDAVLYETEKRYEGILRAIPVAVAVLDADGRLMDANDLFINIDGGHLHRDDNILHKNEGVIAEIRRLFEECRRKGRKVKDQISHRYSVDRDAHWRCYVSPRWDQSYRFNGAVLVMEDATEETEAMNALEQSANRIKTIDQITRHDVTNHLQVLHGYLEMLKDMVVSDNKVDILSRMERSLMSVEDHMDFARTYQSLGVQRPQWLLLRREAESALRHGTPLDVDINLDGHEVWADPSFNRALYNLVENTIRHSGHARRVWLHSHIDEDGSLIIVYEDDGAGIPAGKKESIFRKGVGANTGLGMFLVKEILRLTGMDIQECGREGVGVRFEIKVPSEAHRSAQGDRAGPA